MISAAQAAAFRAKASKVIAGLFPTTITIGNHADIPAARCTAAKAAKVEVLGVLLPTAEIVVRVEAGELSTRAITIKENQTSFVEGGIRYRVLKVRQANGDPGILIEAERA